MILDTYSAEEHNDLPLDALVKMLSHGKLALCANGFKAQSEAKNDLNHTQIHLCHIFIEKYCIPRKTINGNRSSYGYKHDVESWTTILFNIKSYIYISNGAFIAAAIKKGFKAEVPDGSLNACFNLTLDRKKLVEGGFAENVSGSQIQWLK